jgi:hypothetical protein
MPADESELEGRKNFKRIIYTSLSINFSLYYDLGEGNDALNTNRTERWTDLGLDHFGQN